MCEEEGGGPSECRGACGTRRRRGGNQKLIVLLHKWINKTVSIQQRKNSLYSFCPIPSSLYFFVVTCLSRYLSKHCYVLPLLPVPVLGRFFIPILHILWDTQQKLVPFIWSKSQSYSSFFPSINSSGFVPGERKTIANQVCNILLKKNPWILWKWIRFSIFFYHLVDIWSEM